MQGEAPRNDEFGFHLEEKPDPPFEWREFGLEDWPAFLVFWGLTVIVFLQFFTRYVLNDSFGWTEEAARYFLIGTTFIGGGMVCRRRAHIAVEYLHTRLSRAGSRRLMIVVDVITIAFLAYLGWVGWRMIGMSGAPSVSNASVDTENWSSLTVAQSVDPDQARSGYEKFGLVAGRCESTSCQVPATRAKVRTSWLGSSSHDTSTVPLMSVMPGTLLPAPSPTEPRDTQEPPVYSATLAVPASFHAIHIVPVAAFHSRLG